jgi:hypothetical protein
MRDQHYSPSSFPVGASLEELVNADQKDMLIDGLNGGVLQR